MDGDGGDRDSGVMGADDAGRVWAHSEVGDGDGSTDDDAGIGGGDGVRFVWMLAAGESVAGVDAADGGGFVDLDD